MCIQPSELCPSPAHLIRLTRTLLNMAQFIYFLDEAKMDRCGGIYIYVCVCVYNIASSALPQHIAFIRTLLNLAPFHLLFRRSIRLSRGWTGAKVCVCVYTTSRTMAFPSTFHSVHPHFPTHGPVHLLLGRHFMDEAKMDRCGGIYTCVCVCVYGVYSKASSALPHTSQAYARCLT